MIGMTLLLVLVAVAAASAYGYFAFQRDLRARRERLRGKSRVVATEVGPIEYAEAGRGPPVLICTEPVEVSIKECNSAKPFTQFRQRHSGFAAD